MNLSDYEMLLGIESSNDARTIAALGQAQSTIEALLGFTLDTELVADNFYTEIGKTTSECSCPVSSHDNLNPPDAVQYAYRLFPYNKKDTYLSIDPCTEIHAIKLVNNGVTCRTLDINDYNAHSYGGLIKYIEQCHRFCLCKKYCVCTQLAVDAEWVWQDEGSIPTDLMYVWAELAQMYSNDRRDIKSETLGTHRYEKFDDASVNGILSRNMAVLSKYAGPNGTSARTVTI